MAKISRGRMGKADEQFIRDNYATMEIEDIARHIGKTVESVRDKMGMLGINLSTADDRKLNAFADIRQSVYWTQLKQELTNDELRLFIEHWKEIISQFQDNIYHTEKIQVMDLIKMEILMSRDLKKEKEIVGILDDLKIEIDKISRSKLSTEEKALKLEPFQARYGHLISVARDLRGSYEKLSAEKNRLLKATKGSRDQRIKHLESSKETIHAWMAELIANPELRRKMGQDMEKMRLAMQVEYERLTDWHVYADGTVDRPINNAETAERPDDEPEGDIDTDSGGQGPPDVGDVNDDIQYDDKPKINEVKVLNLDDFGLNSRSK